METQGNNEELMNNLMGEMKHVAEWWMEKYGTELVLSWVVGMVLGMLKSYEEMTRERYPEAPHNMGYQQMIDALEQMKLEEICAKVDEAPKAEEDLEEECCEGSLECVKAKVK